MVGASAVRLGVRGPGSGTQFPSTVKPRRVDAEQVDGRLAIAPAEHQHAVGALEHPADQRLLPSRAGA